MGIDSKFGYYHDIPILGLRIKNTLTSAAHRGLLCSRRIVCALLWSAELIFAEPPTEEEMRKEEEDSMEEEVKLSLRISQTAAVAIVVQEVMVVRIEEVYGTNLRLGLVLVLGLLVATLSPSPTRSLSR